MAGLCSKHRARHKEPDCRLCNLLDEWEKDIDMDCEHKDASRTAYPLPGGRYLTICEDCRAWYTSHESGWQPPRNPPRRTRLAELVTAIKMWRHDPSDDCPPFEGDPAEREFIEPDEGEGDQEPLCDRVGILERLGGRLDTQLQSTWTVASRADRAFTNLKARVDVIAEVMPDTPLPGEEGSRITLPGLVSRMTTQHLRMLQQQQRFEKLEQRCHDNEDATGELREWVHHTVDPGIEELEAAFRKLNEDEAISHYMASGECDAEVEALVKQATVCRENCPYPLEQMLPDIRALYDRVDALIAKQAEKGT